jgi:hypothetical protein
MITREQIAEVLRNRKEEDGISEVKIDPEGDVLAKLENRFELSQPHMLTVHLFVEERELRIRIPLVTGERQDNAIPGVLASARICLAGGRLMIDSKNGITFEVNHVIDDDENNRSAELLGQLLDAMVRDFRRIEMLILYAKRLAQVSQDIVSTMP